MSNPEFRQPSPAASLKDALAAQRKVTDTLREEAAKIRRGDTDIEGPERPTPTSEKGKP